MDYLQLATQYLEPKLKGKYIYLDIILPLLNSLNSDFEITQIEKSVQGRAIHQVKIGTGTTKILMWSQMHGNNLRLLKVYLISLISYNRIMKLQKELNRIIPYYAFQC